MDSLKHPCPICMEREDDAPLDGLLPMMPFDRRFPEWKKNMLSAICYQCGQSMCAECVHNFCKASIKTPTLPKCPFCRAPVFPSSQRQSLKKLLIIAESKHVCRRVVTARRVVASTLLSGSIGCRIDEPRAVNLYRQNANDGDPRSMFHLAMCYKFGRGCEQNFLEFQRWMRCAAAEGLSCAQYEMGMYLMENKSPKTEMIEHIIPYLKEKVEWMEAIRYFKALANKGYDDVCLKLAYLLFADLPSKDMSLGLVMIRRAKAHEKKYNGSKELIRELKDEDKEICKQLLEETKAKKIKNFENKCRTCLIDLKNPLLCSQCQKVSYCSKICQKVHWKYGHKFECCPR